MKINQNRLNRGITAVLFFFLSTFLIYSAHPQSATSQQQTRKKITGTVSDSSQEPIIGANVIIKGTSIGAITDIDGNFSLEGVSPKAILQISFIGYLTKEIPVGAQNTIKAVLTEDSKALDEVVVVGYGTQKRASITGSVANVSSKELLTVKTASVANTLVGKLPGLRSVQRSGAPGEDIPEMDIRGFGNALIIVDGVERGFAKLDPNDVESVSILKDASAAVYGSKGANGVILVTTKKGTEGKPKFEYSGWYGFQKMTRYPKVNNSLQYATLTNEAANNIGNADIYNEEQMQNFRDGNGEFYKSTNWLDAITRDSAPETSHNFSIRGGNKIARYYLSAGIMDQQSYFVSNDWNNRRYNMHAHVGTTLAKGLTVDLLLTAQSDQRNISGGSGVFANLQQAMPFGSPYYYGEPVGPLRSTFKEYGYSKHDERFLNTSVDINWELPWVKGLSAKAKLSYDYRNYQNKNFSPKDPYTYEPTITNEIVKNYIGATVGKLNQDMGNNFNKDIQFSLNYTRSFGAHDFSGMLMYQATNPSYEWISGYREYQMNAFPFLNAGNDLNKDNGGLEGSSLVKAYIARINYAYANKYLVEAVLRYDGSSTFAPDKRWGAFPSVSLGWRISEESFFKDHISFVNNLKLRASYGIVGDQGGFSPFQYVEGYYYPSGKYLFSPNVTTNGLASSGIANPNLTWFESKIANIGFELSVLSGKLNFEFDMFRRDRSGLLARRNLSVPTSFGSDFPEENLNSDVTKGFELSMGHNNTIGDFTYSVKANATITRSQNKYIERAPDGNRYENWRNNSNDRNKNLTWGYTMTGQFQSFEDILNSPVQDNSGNKTLLPGDYKYKDLNGDNIIDSNDMSVIGLGNTPFIYYGLNLNASWKNFDVNLMFQGAAGHKIQLGSAFYQSFMNEGNSNGMSIWMNRSHRVDPKDPSSEWILGKLPAVRKAGFANNEKVNSYYLLNANYLRLKNVEIGYTLPKSLSSRMGIERLRVFFNGSNLLTFTNGWLMDNIDPENSNPNAWYYPQAKLFNFGLNLSF